MGFHHLTFPTVYPRQKLMQSHSIPAPIVPLLPVILLAFPSGSAWHAKNQANKTIMDLKIMLVRFWTLKPFPISAHFDCKTFPKGNRHKYRQKLTRKHSYKLNSKCLPQNLLLCFQLLEKLSCSLFLKTTVTHISFSVMNI